MIILKIVSLFIMNFLKQIVLPCMFVLSGIFLLGMSIFLGITLKIGCGMPLLEPHSIIELFRNYILYQSWGVGGGGCSGFVEQTSPLFVDLVAFGVAMTLFSRWQFLRAKDNGVVLASMFWGKVRLILARALVGIPVFLLLLLLGSIIKPTYPNLGQFINAIGLAGAITFWSVPVLLWITLIPYKRGHFWIIAAVLLFRFDITDTLELVWVNGTVMIVVVIWLSADAIREIYTRSHSNATATSTIIEPSPVDIVAAGQQKWQWRFWYDLAILIGLVLIAVSWWSFNREEPLIENQVESDVYYGDGREPLARISNQQIGDLEPSTGEQSIRTISELCVYEKNTTPQTDYIPGEVILDFPNDVTSKDILNYLHTRNLSLKSNQADSLENYFLYHPTEVILFWSDSFFSSLKKVTLNDVNRFLDRVRSDGLVKSIEPSLNWMDHREDHVTKVDRLGYFDIVLAENVTTRDFLKKYTEATFVSEFEGAGSQNTIRIIYDAQPIIDILNRFKAEGVLVREPQPNERTSTGSQPLPPVTFRNYVEDLGYTTRIVLSFRSEYTRQGILSALSHYPEIDIQRTVIEDHTINSAVVSVPVGEEECWARELARDSLLEGASPNELIQYIY